jgi:hypothetical protein
MVPRSTAKQGALEVDKAMKVYVDVPKYQSGLNCHALAAIS